MKGFVASQPTTVLVGQSELKCISPLVTGSSMENAVMTELRDALIKLVRQQKWRRKRVYRKRKIILRKNASKCETTGSLDLISGKSEEICVLWCIIAASKCKVSNGTPVFGVGCVDNDENLSLCALWLKKSNILQNS